MVPYYSYSTNNGPQDPILIVKAPVLLDPQASWPWRHPFVHDAQDQSIVEARKSEHHSPHALKVTYKGS